MFYYNTKYHFKLKEGCPQGAGGIILASAMSAEQLVRRQFKRYPQLEHRLFDPQLYLASLDARKAEHQVLKLATYKWFGQHDVPEYNSRRHGTQREYKNTYALELLQSWTRSPPSDAGAILEAARAAVSFQLALGCEAIVLPGPMTDSLRGGFEEEARWIDAGLAACREKRVSLPVYATVAVTDTILRKSTPLRDALLDAVAGHIATRERLAGAYIVFEQATEEGTSCTSGDTLLSLLILIDDLVRGAGKQVVVNFAGSFGAISMAAGASTWATGYYPSQRRLRTTDHDEREGPVVATPRYFSLKLLGDVGLKTDLPALYKRGFTQVLSNTIAAKPLHAALKAGGSAADVALWEYAPGNHGAAMPHYYECMYGLGRHLNALERAERVDFLQKWLEQAAELSDTLSQLRPKLGNRTELSHQRTWLNVFEQWRKRAGV